MKVERVPVEWVNQTWPRVEKFVTDALEHAKGDYTAEQVKVYLAQGVWTLLVATEGAEIKGAATLHFFNRPNARVALVTAIGGAWISDESNFAQLKVFALSQGATVIEGAVNERIAALWLRMFGFTEKYRIVGVQI